MNNDFTFIIQGPYYEDHLEMIDRLKKYGKVIISTEKKYIDKVSKNIKLYDKVCFFDECDVTNIYNYQNMFKHAHSVLQGLKITDTKYCIIMRGSHSYSNIEYILDIVRNNESDKYICDNLTINHTMPYHLSETILAGKKEILIGICETLINSILNKDFIYEGIDIRIRAEVAFFTSYLKYKKISIQKDFFVWFKDVDDTMYYFPLIDMSFNKFLSNMVQLIDVKKLQPCVVKYNHHVINLNHTYDTIEDVQFQWELKA